jgi:methionyl aminopeptidase
MTKSKIQIKTPDDIKKMTEGGKKLGKIKRKLRDAIGVGVSAADIEKLAVELIAKANGKPSFKMVDKYNWATCVDVNDGVVHGVPKKSVIFKKGDVVSVDVGMYYKGFHTDSAFSVGIDALEEINKFLKVGKDAIFAAIEKARVGNRIYDISNATETTLEKGGVTPVRALVGHGVGKKLHEAPPIPCFVNGKRENSPVIPEGAVFAIEVMYTMGGFDLKRDDDGWTIRTCDGTISALFEETVAVTKSGPVVLTKMAE